MKRLLTYALAIAALASVGGCRLPGKPKADSTPKRPSEITDFHTLYSQNCAACHGVEGRGGAAVSLANVSYIAYAGEASIQAVTANGIPGSLMPGFGKAAGGLLTEQQVGILAQGIAAWASPQQLAALHPPPYQSTAVGDAARGQDLYRADCLRCHAPGHGSVLDPVYLSLISNGGLRTLIIAGAPQYRMPDWRGYPGGPLTDQQVADLVSFLVSHRRPAFPFTASANVSQPTGATP